jgi:hypothetical protein
MIDFTTALESVIDAITKEKGAKKELEGMFEELPGEISEVIQEQLVQNIRYVVVDRLINTTAVREMDNAQINEFISSVSILIGLKVAEGYLKRIADAIPKPEPKPEPEIGYA